MTYAKQLRYLARIFFYILSDELFQYVTCIFFVHSFPERDYENAVLQKRLEELADDEVSPVQDHVFFITNETSISN